MTNELWSEEKIALLKQLWNQEFTGAQIAKIMAEKKMPTPTNAIYKKAKRLGLAARVSPIFVKTEKKEPEKIKTIKQPIASKPIAQKPIEPVFLVKPPSVPDKNLINVIPEYDKSTGCCWPIGDPKKPDFRFCGEKRIGRNYCARHEKRAFVRP